MNGLHEPYYPALLRVRLSLTLTDSGNRAGVEPTHHPSKRTDRSFHFSYRFHVVDARPGGFVRVLRLPPERAFHYLLGLATPGNG